MIDIYEEKRAAAMEWINNNVNAAIARADFMLRLRLRWDDKFRNTLRTHDVKLCSVHSIDEAAQSCGGKEAEDEGRQED